MTRPLLAALLVICGCIHYDSDCCASRLAPCRIAMLREALPGTDLDAADALAGLLREDGCVVTALTADDVCRSGCLGTNRFDAYFIPNAPVYPARGFPELRRYIENTGNLVVIGGPAFSRPAWLVGDRWLDRDGIDALIGRTPTAEVLLDVADPRVVAGWRRTSKNPSATGALRRIPGGVDRDGWCVEYSTLDYSGWDTWRSPRFDGLFGLDHDLLCLWAKGDAHTGQVAIELNERDGSRWIAVIDVNQAWARFALHPGRFVYWHDSPTRDKRGGVGDALVASEVVTLTIGLASTHTRLVAPGAHRFWIDAVGTAANPLPEATGWNAAPLPVIETVSPQYKVFTFAHAAHFEDHVGRRTALVGDATELTACVPRPRGFSTDGNPRPYSWRPLVTAIRSSDAGSGCVAWVLKDGRPGHVGRVVALGAGEQTVLRNRPLRVALLEGVRVLRKGEPAGAHERAKPVPAVPAGENDFVVVHGGDFRCGGRPWYPVGVNFWPRYVAGMERDDYFGHWLDPKWYDGEAVEEELRRAAGLGVNMVAIQCLSMHELPNLLDFLARCGAHGIKVYLYTVWTSPLNFQADEFRRFVDAGRLSSNATLLAYDLIWEPGNHLFHSARRGQWDDEWRNWIAERYGSLDSAETDWAYAAPRKGELVSHPDDRQLKEDGAWRAMVAAYRRFMDDVTSRKWNDAVRQLRATDPNHLVSFRQGNTLPHDFAFTGPVKHIDFVCPEGYAISHGEDGFLAACFTTRFVDFTTGGRPVVWMEFGKSVWSDVRQRPDSLLIDEQAAYHDLFYRMVLETGADGTCPWWWPGGYRVDERSDFGIVNLDGTCRPAAELLAGYAPALKASRPWPAAAEWFLFDRDAHPGGYWHVVFNQGKDAYAAARKRGAMLGVRTEATGTTSVGCPLTAVGNRPGTGRNPPKYLNAEFNWVQVKVGDRWVDVCDGGDVVVPQNSPVCARVSVGNLQEAAWVSPAQAGGLPGGVCLASRDESDVALRVPVSETVGRFEDVEFENIELVPRLPAPLSVVFQMHAENRSRFGEVFDFRLVPSDAGRY